MILASRDYDRWLDPTVQADSLRALLKPYAADEMEAHWAVALVNAVWQAGVDVALNFRVPA